MLTPDRRRTPEAQSHPQSIASRHRPHLVVILVAALFTFWALTFIFRTSFIAIDGRRYFSLFDDAMISMRYAWNVTHGLGLVWNPGELVEGYTNLLMVGLMSLWTSLLDKPAAVLAVQLSGIPVMLGIAALTRLHWLELARGNDVGHGESYATLAFLGALAYYPLTYWTLMGMETGLLTLMLLAGSLLSLSYVRTGMARALNGAALVFSLASLARPDSALVAVGVLAAAAAFGQGTRGGRLAAAARGIALYLVFPALQACFRGFYYGSLVPVTYTLKVTGLPLGMRLENGLGFTMPFLQETQWAFLLAGVGAVTGFSKRKALLAVPPVVLVAYQVAIGGDAWPYWRLLAPAMPYLILLMLAAIEWLTATSGPVAQDPLARWRRRVDGWSASAGNRLLELRSLRVLLLLTAAGLLLAGVFADYLRPGSPGFGRTQLYLVAGGAILAAVALRPRGMWRGRTVAMAVLFLLLASVNSRFLGEAFFFELPYKADPNRNHVNAALSILQFTTQDASVGVFQAGIIPYYTSRYGVDFLGKNDPHIATLPIDLNGGPAWYGMSSVPGHNKYDLEYSIRQRRPTYVEGFSWGAQDLSDVFRSQYVEVSLPGPDPAFLRGDPAVRWDLIPPDLLLQP